MRGILTASFAVALAVLVGCGSTTSNTSGSTTRAVNTTSDDIPRISPIPITPQPATSVVVPPENVNPPAAAAGCDQAPAKIVDMINASFTNGEHLEMTQSVRGPSGTVIVGGNIMDPDGTKVSSSDSWLMSGGAIYGLSSDARRHTLVPDGRDVLGDNWPTYNDAVGECVQQAERTANR